MDRRLIKRVAIFVAFTGLSIGGWLGARADAVIAVPSGQPLSFLEFLSEDEGEIVRFRFLAPQIGEAFSYADVMGDFQVICDEQIIPVLDTNALTPRQIVLSMSAVDIPFGEDAPDVLQFFELFSAENGRCIWEEF